MFARRTGVRHDLNMGEHNLASRHCEPCEGGVEPLTRERIHPALGQLPGWTLTPGGRSIWKEWVLRDFREAVAFVIRVADLAEAEGHHPDLCLRSYRRVRIDLTTHAIGGLSENDLILAAKVEQVAPRSGDVLRGARAARLARGSPDAATTTRAGTHGTTKGEER